MVTYFFMYLCICLCTCREKCSWSMTFVQMLSYLQQWLTEHSVRVAMRMALSHLFFPFYSGNKAEINKTKAFKMGFFFSIHSEIGEGKSESLEKIWDVVYSWGWASSPNDEKGAVGETKSFKNIFLLLYLIFPSKSFLEIAVYHFPCIILCFFLNTLWTRGETNALDTFLS